jgi:hypothetical protein
MYWFLGVSDWQDGAKISVTSIKFGVINTYIGPPKWQNPIAGNENDFKTLETNVISRYGDLVFGSRIETYSEELLLD